MNWAIVNGDGVSVAQAEHPRGADGWDSLPAAVRAELLPTIRATIERCEPGRVERRFEGGALRVEIEPLRVNGAARLALLTIAAAPADGAAPSLLARRAEEILRSCMDGFFVLDRDARFLTVNDAFCRMVGYDAAELLQKRISDLETDGPELASSASQAPTGMHQFPSTHRHPDGHIVQLEMSVNILRDRDERFLVGFARDVTERNRVESTLMRLISQQKLILNSAAEGIVGLDPEGRISFVNPAVVRLLGHRPSELIGRSAARLLADNESCQGSCPAERACPLCQVLSGERQSLAVGGRMRRAGGDSIPVEFSLASMLEGHRVSGAVLVFRDMTEREAAAEHRRALEAQILQSQKLESLGLLAGGIAHDLNNMLVGILGNASLTLQQLDCPPGVRERIERIVGACERAAKVIRQILTYSGQVTCDPVATDLNKLVADMVEFMRAAVPRSIRLDIDLAPHMPPIEADGGQIQQVLTNLLVNSIEAIGGESGTIHVRTRAVRLSAADLRARYPLHENAKPGRFVQLEVQDDGCGMSAETLGRIFDPFFSRKGAGRGLGLSATLGIVKAHRGAVAVESQLKRGTRFSLVFPVAAGGAAEVAAPALTPRASGLHVMVIDDDDEVREVLHEMLTLNGFCVSTARDGIEGVARFKDAAPPVDLVLLDMTMPGKSGLDVLRELRQVRPDQRVIVSSGYSESSLLESLGDAGPVAFLHKPFTTQTLLERIQQAMTMQPHGG